MAKVGLWLHGARGKLAGATLYKGVGGTQIRQIVEPENPMTEAQAMQRMIFSTVGHAWKALSPYISNKWQNANNNKIAFRQFFRNNVAYIKAGVLAGTIDHCFNIKGSHVFAPNVYQIASGTLNPIIPNRLDSFFNESFGISGLNIPCKDAELLYNWEVESNQDYVRVLANIGCKPGDTLTVITVESKENDHDATYNGAVNDRVKINVEFVRFKQIYDEGMNGFILTNANHSISDKFIAEKSNGNIYISKTNYSLDQAIIGLESSSDYDYYCAGAVIRSRRLAPDNEYDLRELSSNARFIVAESDFENGYNNATIERVLPSYMGIADPVQDKFLNQETPEYPVYSGTKPIENVQLLITNDSLIQDIEDTIFNGTLNETNSKVNISGKWLVNDDEYPKLVSNVEFDKIVVNGVTFVKTGTGGATRLYYTPVDWASYFSWFRIITEGEKDALTPQKILLYKDNNVYAVPYDFICRILFADDREHSTIETAVVGFEGTLYDLYSLSTPMRVPVEVDEQALISIFAEAPIDQSSIGFKNDINQIVWQELDGNIENGLAWHFEHESIYWDDIFYYNTKAEFYIDIYESLFDVHAELERV